MKDSHRSTRFQITAALALGGVVVAGAVVLTTTWKDPKPDPCQAASQSSAAQDGAKLCTALEKAGLPALLGVPKAQTAYGGQMAVPSSTPTDYQEVHVEWIVGQYAVLLSTSKSVTVKPTEQLAAHPAALLSGTSGGHQVNRLEVAWTAAGGGAGIYAVDVMMADGSAMAQSDAGRLERAVAAKVLPGLPEWRAS
ncbi:DUF6215 domain-containing protein [Catenulispora rubra]|uniref:DUF6215 domain-containing protein n=1 Tax=Catenulispora rubra TaxID=280293 RepID=UPI0018925AB0|nr:DUF6215 domain-containing protein [Catenulispora rubra]